MDNSRESLYGLRFIFAIGIAIFHYSSLLTVRHDDVTQPFFGLLKYAYSKGWYGVEVFFLISGFTFYWIYADSIRHNRISFKDFCVNRISRIFPLYWFSTFCILYIKHLSLHLSKKIMPECDVFDYSVAGIALNILGLRSGIVDGTLYPYNPAAWTISTEIVLYLLFYLTIYLSKTFSPKWGDWGVYFGL